MLTVIARSLATSITTPSRLSCAFRQRHGYFGVAVSSHAVNIQARFVEQSPGGSRKSTQVFVQFYQSARTTTVKPCAASRNPHQLDLCRYIVDRWKRMRWVFGRPEGRPPAELRPPSSSDCPITRLQKRQEFFVRRTSGRFGSYNWRPSGCKYEFHNHGRRCGSSF